MLVLCIMDKKKFPGNNFCLLPNHHAAFVVIQKNANSFLKQTAYFLKTNKIEKNFDLLNVYKIGEQPKKIKGIAEYLFTCLKAPLHGKEWRARYLSNFNYLIPVSEMPEYEKANGKLMKFAVHRDPVGRFISCYKFFISEVHLRRKRRKYFEYLDLYNDTSFERFVQFAEFELSKSNIENQDAHFRRQSDFYKPEDVDYIVPMEKLSLFLEEKGIPTATTTKANATQPSVPEDVTPELIDRIKKLYSADYNIKVNY